jgi:hypothetical protein
MPWSVATILNDPPLRRKRSFASHASQTSSIRDNQELIGDYTHLSTIYASFCLSTYSGNFLIDDQFAQLLGNPE